MFSFSDEAQCRVIGVTSSVQGEGKSSTACNTAYALAVAGAKVLLIDADLRRPSIAAKLGLARAPGVTNLLITKGDFHEAIQHCNMAPNLDIITSGDIPPNPSELLSSGRMSRLVEQLKMEYSYIVVDLPPVTVVSDAMAMSKLLDGVVMVVRNAVADRKLLEEALRQLKLVNVRILGFVYRDNNLGKKAYGKKYKYYAEYDKKSQFR
jgi:capsular exopolysaccharide synthesis family protein